MRKEGKRRRVKGTGREAKRVKEKGLEKEEEKRTRGRKNRKGKRKW